MKISRFVKRASALAIFLSAAFSVNVAAQPNCGEIIIDDTTLTGNLLGCSDRGLSIGASGVTLDCDYHTIEAAGNRVVEIFGGLSDITVKNCVLVSTANTDALRVNNGASNILITGNDITTSGTQSRGIRMNRTSLSVVSNNKVTTTGQSSDAIRLSGSSNNEVIDNQVTTSGETARGFRIETGADNNLVRGNVAHITGLNSSGVLLRSGANGNRVELNLLRADNGQAIRIESSSNNEFLENTLVSNIGWLRSRRFTLQNGGLSVHPNGRIFAVENNFGSASGVGTSTALVEVDPATSQVVQVTQLTQGGSTLNFGFDALEITSDGRFLAFEGAGSGLYEINPSSGEVQLLFFLGGFNGSLNGMDSNVIGELLVTTNQGDVHRIGLDPPGLIPIGSFGAGWTDVAVHPASDSVYVMSRHIQESTGTNHLYEINFSTGVANLIGDTAESFISDIDFANDGTLYGNGSALLRIDPATAATVRIGGFGEDPFEPPSENNVLSKTTLDGIGGSVHYPGDLAVPSGVQVDVSTADLNISFNRVFVDSGTFPFLNAPATITLNNLSGSSRVPLVDLEDDGTFVTCGSDWCSAVSFVSGTLQFDVTGFTTYSSKSSVTNRGLGPDGSGPPGPDGNGPPGLQRAPGPNGEGPPGLTGQHPLGGPPGQN